MRLEVGYQVYSINGRPKKLPEIRYVDLPSGRVDMDQETIQSHSNADQVTKVKRTDYNQKMRPGA